MNGGAIVPLENRADYLIADHARQKDAPPGSYSYQFIEDSVKNGILQVEDRYLICQPDMPRPPGSSAPIKRTRAPFTKAEDAALVEWVLSHHTARTGNAIYQEFEAHVSPVSFIPFISFCRTYLTNSNPEPQSYVAVVAESLDEEPVQPAPR